MKEKKKNYAIKYIVRFGGIRDCLLVKILIVFFADMCVVVFAFGITTTRDDLNSGCIGKVRHIVGGGATKTAGRG
jgi:hypothetical protein